MQEGSNRLVDTEASIASEAVMVGSGKKERSGGLCREAYAAMRNGRRLLGRICSLFDNCLGKEKINKRKKKTTQ